MKKKVKSFGVLVPSNKLDSFIRNVELKKVSKKSFYIRSSDLWNSWSDFLNSCDHD